MTSRERMNVAMRPRERGRIDRVPVMCQLALGHYFLHAGADPVEIWHDTRAFGDALIALQRRYGFDGILVNLPGRDPKWRGHIKAIERGESGQVVYWKTGQYTVVPPDDNAYVCLEGTGKPAVTRFEDVEPRDLFYVEPYDRLGVACLDEFPDWQCATVRYVRGQAPDVSIHAEVFSPFTQLMELVGCMEAALALATSPQKVSACLASLTRGTIALAAGYARAGADAVLISSAYAGAGFISPRHYEQFVLPCERQVIQAFKAVAPRVPVYTHTCGAIGDRLELMERTGTNGIDTLDPPPLGTVDLADAKARLGNRLFIKGNMDPVHTILEGTVEACDRDARERLAIGAPGGGYILSTACSVPPHAPPENVMALARAVADAA
jgi:hypothetical protein